MVSDLIGLHLAMGAFLAGAVAPADMFRRAAQLIEPISTYVLLPFFFISSTVMIPAGLDYFQFSSVTLVALVIAVLSKFVSGAVAARIAGFSWEDSTVIGSLLQCKGVMEIVAVAMARDAGIVSPAFAASFILVSLATTILAKPMAHLSALGLRHRRSVG